jgi:hypothetical protein
MSQAALPHAPIRGPAVATWVAVVTALWFVCALAISLSGIFVSHAGLPWKLLLAAAAPVAAFALAYRWFPALRAFVLDLDLSWLILIHSWRFVGMSFLFLSSFDLLPLLFSVPAGVGDALVAVGALYIGLSLYSSRGVSRGAVYLWNTGGLADFVIALGMGALTGSAGLLSHVNAIPSDPMEAFPLSMVPGFLVPLFAIAHVIVFLQLRTRWKGHARIRASVQ